MHNKIYVKADEIVTPDCDVESQETIIHWGREDHIASIFTSDPTTVTRLKNLMKEDPTIKCYYIEGNMIKGSNRPSSYQFECDKSQVTIRKASERKELSDEEKAIVVERLKKRNSN